MVRIPSSIGDGMNRLLSKYIKRGGIFIVSGIIKERENEVKKAIENYGLKMLEKKYDRDWVAVFFKYA